MTKTYLIDLDGTMYSGNTNIDGAREFIEYLNNNNIPHVFLTNNATRTKKQAKEHMLNLGFKNITVEKVESDRFDTGKVVSQNIPAGTEIVPKDKELIIQVSSGKKKVSMPNLVGEDSSRAESVIASYGFKNVSYKEEYSDKEAGTVISQSIRSGSSIIPSEESLEIIISKGKEKKTSKEDSDTDARTNNDNNSNNSSSRNTNSSTNINYNDRRDNS